MRKTRWSTPLEVEQAGEQQGPHFAHRGAQRVAAFAEHIPEADRERLIEITARRKAQSGNALGHFSRGRASLGQTRKIALDVGQKDRHAQGAEGFGQALQGHGLARARGPGDQAVAIAHGGQDADIPFPGAGHERLMVIVQHGRSPLGPVNAMPFCPPAASDFTCFFGRVPEEYTPSKQVYLPCRRTKIL